MWFGTHSNFLARRNLTSIGSSGFGVQGLGFRIAGGQWAVVFSWLGGAALKRSLNIKP